MKTNFSDWPPFDPEGWWINVCPEREHKFVEKYVISRLTWSTDSELLACYFDGFVEESCTSTHSRSVCKFDLYLNMVERLIPREGRSQLHPWFLPCVDCFIRLVVTESLSWINQTILYVHIFNNVGAFQLVSIRTNRLHQEQQLKENVPFH